MQRRFHSSWLTMMFGSLVSAACIGPNATRTPSSTPDPFGSIVVGKDEPIRIGTLLAASGEAGGAGIDSLRGVEMAIDYLDGTFDGTPGRLFGRDISLADAEDACTAASGKAGAAAIAPTPGLVGVIGTTCSVSAPGAAEVFSADGVLMISPTAADPSLTEPGSHPAFSLRVAVNAALEGRAAADFAVDALDASTAATISQGGEVAGGPAEVFRAWFGRDDRTIVSAELVDGPQATQRALVQLGAAPPDVVYLTLGNDARSCATAARAAADAQGLASTAVLVSGGCTDAATTAVAGDAVLGGAYVVAPDLSPRSTDDFYRTEVLPAYRAQYGVPPPSPAFAYAFDAASLLLDAVARTAEDGPSQLTIERSALRDVAFGTDAYSGLSGTLSCTELGDCASEARIGVFRMPAVPAASLDPGRPPADPVFTETVALAELVSP